LDTIRRHVRASVRIWRSAGRGGEELQKNKASDRPVPSQSINRNDFGPFGHHAGETKVKQSAEQQVQANQSVEQRAHDLSQHLSALSTSATRTLNLWIAEPAARASVARMMMAGAKVAIEVQVDGLAPADIVLSAIAADGTRVEVARITANAPAIDPASVN
jgi:hypothetical protein